MKFEHRTALIFALLLILMAALSAPVAGEDSDGPVELAIRCDDVGMCHSVNLAVRRMIASGIPFSVSVMVPCPWFPEAAEILREHPEVSVGVHLTLNSEWQHYKWGPVLGAKTVPSLVDDSGHFFASGAEFAAREVDLREVEMELRAQISLAKTSGLRLDYLDYHMLTAVSTPELRAIVERLAAENGLGLSRYFGEHSASLWDVEPSRKLSNLLRVVDQARPGRTNLVVMHLGLESLEMLALVDANNPSDPFRVAQHRQAELDAITSPAFREAVRRKGIRLVTYRNIVERVGLAAMKWPGEAGYDSTGDDEQD
jgi:predicted glycoside hydrolase/deacetylase ChbG (UPF0249 family)